MANISALYWDWEYIGDGYDSRPFLIDGIDVFKHRWELVPNAEKIGVVSGNHDEHFSVYSVKDGEKTIVFAAGEIAPNAFGFCRKIAR